MNELLIANAALDAVKQRYGFEGFHLYGHSGGSMMEEGLVGLREDIACAVAADGTLLRQALRPGTGRSLS